MFCTREDLIDNQQGIHWGQGKALGPRAWGSWRVCGTYLPTSRELACMNTFALLCLADTPGRSARRRRRLQ
jgi:hypothetical protein